VREGGVCVFMAEFIFRGTALSVWLENVGDLRVRLRRVLKLKRALTLKTSEGRKTPPCACALRAGVTPPRLN